MSVYVKVCDKSADGIRRFCELPTTENDVLSEKENFEVEMQYKAATNCNNSLSGPERKDLMYCKYSNNVIRYISVNRQVRQIYMRILFLKPKFTLQRRISSNMHL